MIDLKALAAPFPPEKISWRAQTVSNGKALALAYIDARDVQDRLDQVCGPENWQNRYTHTQGKTVCEIGINVLGSIGQLVDGKMAVLEKWIWKADGAGDSDIEAEKGALSDAFKRAAVKWGIGRYLYDLESPWVPCELGQNGKFRKFTDDPWKYVRNAPKAATAPQAPAKRAEQPLPAIYVLINPHDQKDKKEFTKGQPFLMELEHMMAQGNAADWWAVNGSTAKGISRAFPQAVKKVQQLEAMASGGLLAAG
jgi:hypothetical protein